MVLLKLAQKMGAFSYDETRSFRGWLKTIARHAWYDFKKEQQRPGRGSGDDLLAQLLDNVEARDDLLQQIEAECAKQLLDEAMLHVALRVAHNTWAAFRLTTLDGKSGAEAGRLLGIPASQVFVHKFRVQKMLEEEVKKLDDPRYVPAARGDEAGQEPAG
jgi:RNA polymerase sigma-70 factor (ECF subfamily)